MQNHFDIVIRGATVYDGHGGYSGLLAARATGVNIGILAGHGTLRLAAMGREDRAAGDRDMAHMKASLREALDAGVFNFSSGHSCEPGRYANTDELVEPAGRLLRRGD